MKLFRLSHTTARCAGLLLAAALTITMPAQAVYAEPGPAAASGQTTATVSQEAEQASVIEKPEIAAEGAVLYDATRGQFLFEKNADTKFYPASITKLMTALLVAEHCGLEGTVTFSETAVSKLESGAVTLKIKAGEKVSVKDCMYGLMLKSANEIANGLAEHVSGSISAFTDKMTEKAKSLGCTNTNFENPNGLNNSEHVTTARDMALIAKAAFENPTVCKVTSTLHYDFPATEAVNSVRSLTMGHKMLDPDRAEYYPGFVGGKTGFTSLAGNTLVTCVEKDGTRLIAVILKSRQTHYSDTKKLLDYGFELIKSGAGGPSGTPAAGITEMKAPGTAETSAPGAAQTSAPGTAETSAPGTAETTAAVTAQTSAPGTAETAASGTAETSAPGTAEAKAAGTEETKAPGTAEKTAVGRDAYPKAEGEWEQKGDFWKFKKKDGTYAANEYLLINGEVYGFDKDGNMLLEWHLVNGSWHNFRTGGNMAFSRWIETNGYYYYVDENGCLFVNGTTPDGYRVDANGVWIQ